MRSIVMKNNSLNKCGICNEQGHWIEEMDIEGTHFVYCHKCNTITFNEEIDKILQHKIENCMNIYYHKMKEERK